MLITTKLYDTVFAGLRDGIIRRSSCGDVNGGDIMAEQMKGMELSQLERGWIKQALVSQSKMLMRSRTKEIVGGEIWVLRGKEIEIVNTLAQRF